MPHPITEEAIRIIDAAPAHGPLRPVEYAEALPGRAAALARVLTGSKIAETAGRFAAADASAIKAQTGFRRLGRASAYSGFAAAALGGALLYLGSESSQEALRANLGLAQFVLLAISLMCAFLLFVSKPYRTWRAERGNAEAMRLKVFALMMSGQSAPKDGEAPLLPLQLECLRRHLLNDQRKYFARRGPQERRTVLVWKVLGAVSLLLVLGASAPQLLRLDPFGLLPEVVRTAIALVPLDQKGYALVGLFGGSLQGLVAALAVISPAQRNADKYKEMLGQLDKYADARLEAVRLAASEADGVAVGEFAKGVSNYLAEEAREWLLLQEALSEMTLSQLAQQSKS